VTGKETLAAVKSVQALVPSSEDGSFEPQSVKVVPLAKKPSVRDGLW
jgi:hypothetical protein